MNDNSIKERIIREIRRRIETKSFANVSFDRVIRRDLPQDYAGAQGSVLAILEEDEVFTNTAGRAMESDMTLLLNFAIALGPDDEGATVINNVSAELVKALSGQKQLEEGGDGTGGDMLLCFLTPKSVGTGGLADDEEVAVGEVRFGMKFRTKTHDPFALVQ